MLAGGIDIGTVISTGGQEFIATGGTTSNTTILSGGLATISGGGTLDLGAGATEAGAVVFAGTGGKLVIDGTVMPGTVISGFAVGDTIDLTGITSGSVTSVGINASNVLQVFAGGSEFDLQLDPLHSVTGQLGYTADGSGIDLTLTSGSSGPTNITVSNGQTSNGLVITSGETLTVLAGGTVNNTILNGGFETDGGVANGTIVSSGSQETVVAGGSTSGVTVLSGGGETILSGGAAISATVLAGGYIQLGQGTVRRRAGLGRRHRHGHHSIGRL